MHYTTHTRCHPGTPSSTLARCHQLERRWKSARSLVRLAASPACDSATLRTTFHLHKPAYPTTAPSGPSSRHAARRCSHAYHSASLRLPPLLLFTHNLNHRVLSYPPIIYIASVDPIRRGGNARRGSKVSENVKPQFSSMMGGGATGESQVETAKLCIRVA